MDIHPLPASFSFLRFSSFVGLFLRLFRWLLRLVSLPQSRAKYSFFISLHLSFSLALLALLFLSFFLSFLRLFRYLFRFLTRAPPSGTVCVCPALFRRVLAFPAGDGDTCIASPSTKLAIHGEDISSGRGTDVPARSLTSCYPTLPRFVSWSFMLPPPNLGFAAESPTRSPPLSSAVTHKQLVQPFK